MKSHPDNRLILTIQHVSASGEHIAGCRITTTDELCRSADFWNIVLDGILPVQSAERRRDRDTSWSVKPPDETGVREVVRDRPTKVVAHGCSSVTGYFAPHRCDICFAELPAQPPQEIA